jgi:hypothetical protein
MLTGVFWIPGSHTAVASPTASNPFSFPLLETIACSPAALHAIQSLSAAFQDFFELPAMSRSLEERGKALACLRQELQQTTVPIETTLLTIIILGTTSSWLTQTTTEIGLEHLLAAHAIVQLLLSDYQDEMERSHVFYLGVSLYIYWDMACSFLVPSHT